jgi:hypothetical protein
MVNVVPRIDRAAGNNRLTNELTVHCHPFIKLYAKGTTQKIQLNYAILNRDHPRLPASVALRKCRCSSVVHKAPTYFYISLLYLSLMLDLNSSSLRTPPGSPAYCNVLNASASLQQTHTFFLCGATEQCFPGCGISYINLV